MGIQRRFNKGKSVAMAAVVLLVAIVAISGVASAIIRGYKTDDADLLPGMIVALSKDSTDTSPKVERASTTDPQRVLGVATTVSSGLVTVSSKSAQVYVETEGQATAYVSDANGPIKRGDLLTVSPLKGIGAKADQYSQVIIGIALQDFNADNAQIYKVKTAVGEQDLKVIKMPITLDRKGGANNAPNDSALRKLGRQIAGKDVGEARVVVALIIFCVVLIAEGGIIYGAVSSAITALGRNPLAKEIIRKELVRVIFIAIMVLLIGLGATYGVLKV